MYVACVIGVGILIPAGIPELKKPTISILVKSGFKKTGYLLEYL